MPPQRPSDGSVGILPIGSGDPELGRSMARTEPDGSFVITGPDPREVGLALVVRATGERVELPQPTPLVLVVPR